MNETVSFSKQHPPKIRALLAEDQGSAFTRYRRVTFADGSLPLFILYELASMLLLPLPGAVGIFLRRKLLKPFFGAMGRNAIIGRNCVFRHPRQMFIGDSVVIDDNVLLDARGVGSEKFLLEDEALISRNVIIKSKGGPVRIGKRVNVGDGTVIVGHRGVLIDDDAAIASGCQIIAGTFPMNELTKPPPQRTSISAGPIEIGAGAWVATGVEILDGVKIGESAVVSAGSTVMRSVAPRTVVQGNPAKKVFDLR